MMRKKTNELLEIENSTKSDFVSLLPLEISTSIFSFLSRKTLMKLATISKKWNEIAIKDSLWQIKNLNINNKHDFLVTIAKLSGFISTSILEDKFPAKKIVELLRLLSKDFEGRKREFPSLTDYQAKIVCSDYGIIAFALDLLTITQMTRIPQLATDHGLIALMDGLLTYQQAIKFTYNGHNNNCTDISNLLSKNGLTALRENLITVEQANKIANKSLAALFTEIGMQALREQLITPTQAAEFYGRGYEYCSNLAELLTPNGLHALRNKLITPEQASKIYRLEALFSNNGLQALNQKLITPEQAAKINDLAILLLNIGIQALEEKLITPEQAALFGPGDSMYYTCPRLSQLLSLNGLKALRSKLITPEEASRIHDLNALLSDLGLQALEERLITPKQAMGFNRTLHQTPRSLYKLLTKEGIVALREKLITPEEALEIDALELLLTSSGLNLLRQKIITPAQAALFDGKEGRGNLLALLDNAGCGYSMSEEHEASQNRMPQL